jgi:hypothetical protein
VIAVELAVALPPLPATAPVPPAPPMAFSISETMPLEKPLTASINVETPPLPPFAPLMPAPP